jgi:hypothetical protein
MGAILVTIVDGGPAQIILNIEVVFGLVAVPSGKIL